MIQLEKFNLKLFREQKLQISAGDLAVKMDLPVDTIISYEENPNQINIELILKLCSVFDLPPNELFNFKPQKPKALEVPPVYEETKEYLNSLDSFWDKKSIQEEIKNVLSPSELFQTVKRLEYAKLASSKPVVAFIGPSDAGKSSMINSITGLDVLLSQWTPTTSATVYLKHIDDKPDWMGSDEVWIFKEENPTSGWDYRKYNDREYCENLKIIGGKKDILTEYANRNKKGKHLNVDSAIIYLDSAVLNGCDIVDLPGFGTDTEKDTIQAGRVRDKADAVVFLCQSNGFFNKSMDIEFAKDVIKHLSRIDNSTNAKYLSNLFIVASQAHIVGHEELPTIFNRGFRAISDQFSDDWIESLFSMDRRSFNECLEPRFFSYSSDSSTYRSSFEKEFTHLLKNVWPKVREKEMRDAVEDFKRETVKLVSRKKKNYMETLEKDEILREEYKSKLNNKEEVFLKIDLEKEKVLNKIEFYKESDLKKLIIWENRNLTEERVIKIINDKGYDKKRAKEFLASNVSDMYHVELQTILKESTMEFKEVLDDYTSNIEESLNKLSKTEMDDIIIPFDFKGALAGGLAGASVMGGLGILAASMGNLGGYILVAKGVSLLSAAGISVGGTAAATSFVAAIGGPITLALGLGVGVFLLGRSLFGDSWKNRIAKTLVKAFKDKHVVNQYGEQIVKFWFETKSGIEELSNSLKQQYEEHIMETEKMLSINPGEVQKLIVSAEMLEKYFNETPQYKGLEIG